MPSGLPESKNRWLFWLAGILVIVVIIVFLSKKDKSNQHITAEAASDSTTVESKINNNWSGVDPNIPVANYEELSDSDLQVHANEDYAVYSMQESVLFEPDKYTIGTVGAAKLYAIAGSAKKRFSNGSFIIYGYTDSLENKALALNRVNAIKAWLVEFEKINPERIDVNPLGESSSIFSNSTEQELKRNRRVDIIVKKN